jgi:hypothetical protein
MFEESNRYTPGIPITGDFFFMPDWSREKGLQILSGREKDYALLMKLLGMESVLRYV